MAKNSSSNKDKFSMAIEKNIRNFFLDQKKYSNFDCGIIKMKKENDDSSSSSQKYKVWVEYNELINVLEADQGISSLQRILKKNMDVFIHKFNSYTPTFNDFCRGNSPRISIIFSEIDQETL